MAELAQRTREAVEIALQHGRERRQQTGAIEVDQQRAVALVVEDIVGIEVGMPQTLRMETGDQGAECAPVDARALAGQIKRLHSLSACKFE